MSLTPITPREFLAVSGKLGSGKDLITSIIQMATCEDREIVEEFYETPLKTLREYAGVFEPLSRFENRKFADQLKHIVAGLLGITVRQMDDRAYKEAELGEEWWYYNIDGETIAYSETKHFSAEDREKLSSFLVKLTPRKLQQLIGTEGGRKLIHPNIWINATFNKCKLNENGERPSWIISDVRFKSERKAVEERGGIVIRVIRYKLLSEWLEDYAIDLSFMEEYENLKMSDVDFLAFFNELDNDILKDVSEKLNHASETELDNATFKYVIHNDCCVEELVNRVREILLTEGFVLSETLVKQ